MDDYLWQFPLKEPLPGDPYIYRQPKIISEMLCAFAAQMTLFSHDTTTKRSRIAQLCANPMPVVFFAAAGGQYRHMAIILLAVSRKYLLLPFKVAYERSKHSAISTWEGFIRFAGHLLAELTN